MGLGRDADPYARWCGRGGAARRLPIPIAANSLSLTGLWVQCLAVGWLAWDLSQSGFWLGAVVFAELVPVIIIEPARSRAIRSAIVASWPRSCSFDHVGEAIGPITLIAVSIAISNRRLECWREGFFEQPPRTAVDRGEPNTDEHHAQQMLQ